VDEAAAVWHVLTSARTVEIVTGPAGTGKTWVLATAAGAWDGPVFGTATSQNATNELRAAGVQVAANITRLLADLTEGRIPPGSLILADEGSMISITHLVAIVSYAARNSCKLVLAGDQEQLAAVEGGGAMMLLADRLGYVQLAEPVRFTAAWERGASLRLRSGDATALDEYDQHGRIRSARPEPSRETPDQRAAWHQAFAALGSPGQPDVRAMADGRLWLLRDTYTPRQPGHPRMSGRSCGCPGSAPSTPPWARSEPPPKLQPPARPTTTTAPHGRRPWPPATGPCATSTSSANTPSPKPWPTGRTGSTPPPLPGTWPSPPTPNCAAATPAIRSSRCSPPKPHPSATPDATASSRPLRKTGSRHQADPRPQPHQDANDVTGGTAAIFHAGTAPRQRYQG
jgi:AAA domain